VFQAGVSWSCFGYSIDRSGLDTGFYKPLRNEVGRLLYRDKVFMRLTPLCLAGVMAKPSEIEIDVSSQRVLFLHCCSFDFALGCLF
jgi:hypothetical protein